jgi:hypothetical protein
MPSVDLSADTKLMLEVLSRHYKVTPDTFLHENLWDRIREDPDLARAYAAATKEWERRDAARFGGRR